VRFETPGRVTASIGRVEESARVWPTNSTFGSIASICGLPIQR
jgi:hypothetical protein